MSQLQVRLFRDSFSKPWGFRLQGGRDIGHALSIQRVFSNSPAEGELQRGDQVLSIGGRPAGELSHQQAQDIVKRGGVQIDLTVYRPAPSRVSTTATFTPAAQRPRAQSVQPVAHTTVSLSRNQAAYLMQGPYASRSQVHSFTQQQQSLYDGGNPYQDYSFPFLRGGNTDFGADYCTLPRNRGRQSSQPPVQRQPPGYSTMPVSGGGSGFKPKKVTLSRLGGGGPDFGSDFTRGRPAAVMQPVHVHTGSRGYQQGGDMLNRVHDSLDNLSLSPRTPDYGYQAPPFAASSPGGGGQYIPTGVRLDMEREQELRQQQQQQQQQPYQSPQAYQPPPQQQYYYEPQQPYVPTGVRLDHQMGEEEEGVEVQPVRERKKAFLNAPARPAEAPTGKHTAPKVLKPKPGSTNFNFGVDYSKPAPKTSTVTWRPQPAQRPVNVPPPQPEPAPAPWSGGQQDEMDQPDMPPAWRTSLRTTGVKPWDKDLEYTAGQQAPAQPRGSSQVPNPDKAGDRDWTQSAVYRMIYEEEHRGRPQHQAQPQQQQQQQPKPPPPPPAPKPQMQTFQQAFTPMDGDYGTSDF